MEMTLKLKMTSKNVFPYSYRPLVPLKVAKASQEVHFGTIPGRVGWGRSNSDYKAISVQLQLQLPTGTELGN